MKKIILIALISFLIGGLQAQENFFVTNIPAASYGIDALPQDIKILPGGGYASSYQNGSNIEKAYDGNEGTLYHSSWSATSFPVTLRFDFVDVEQIDYLVYHPRKSGTNGNFKQFEVWYTTADTPRTKLGDFDFNGRGTDSRITFNSILINPTSIEFVVHSGTGNFASCAEMEFYRINREEMSFMDLFEDDLMTALKPGVTQAQINQINNPFIRDVASSMLAGNYKTDYRIDHFQAHLDMSSLYKKVRITTYSKYENPTGIYFSKGKHVVVVENIQNGKSVNLLIPDYRYGAGGKSLKCKSFPLFNGINIIDVTEWDGLGYISYFSSAPEEEQPVGIHFMKGYVHGYFDITKHTNADWNNLLNNATKYPVMDAIGLRSQLTYPVESYKSFAWDKGMELVNVYDSIVMYEQQLFGWEKYNKQIKNHVLWRVNYDYYAYKDDDGCSFEVSYMNHFVNPNMLNELSKYESWTTIHELGHAHQFDFYKWHGMTEVSVNIPNIDIMHRRQYETTRFPETNYQKAYDAIVAQGGSHAGCPEYYESTQNIYLKLVPFAQLYHYFAEQDNYDFYPDLFEALRNTSEDNTGWGMPEYELNFIEKACAVSRLNLVPFFEKWGFMYYTDKDGRSTFTVGDYGGSVTYSLAKSKVDEFKAKIQAKGYAEPTEDITLIKPNGGRIR
ncbi:MAG: M60 family metallopeptidase [Bacteroidales bacterium]|nr:M60 family metallopeptidase [Bacteroidales bacterium]